PIMNTEGATAATLKISMRERLEVLSVDAQPQGESVRFKLTWDDSHAGAASDAVDPTSGDPAAPFNKLQGQSVEFTLSPNGALSDFKGLEDVLPGGVPPPEAVGWISSLTASHEFPRGGIAVGQRWRAERPISGAPLAGLFWQTQSTYDHNEGCATLAAQAPRGAKHATEQCAIILSQMNIARHGSGRANQTPPDYLHNGLRTAGTWTGSGDEMGSIAIQTGLLISATETSSQNMDYAITSATSGSSVHYTSKVQSQTGITLIAQSQNADGDAQ
ncbi:MAG TPA: hypothetical protein VJS43_04600, partial [Candidatus Acidoferrales bacterium]|nr:hypothetical protein [Candidatus Acidoferrales bacterium]